MKKPMIVLLCVMSSILSLAFGFYEKTQDNKQLDSIEFTGNAMNLYVKDPSVSVQDELQELQRISAKYQATIIRTDKLSKEGEEITFKSGVYSDDYFENLNLDLTQGHKPTADTHFLATYPTSDPNQSGIIRDLFNDHPLVFGSLDRFYQENEINVTGTYTLIVSPEFQDEVVRQLVTFFGTTSEELLVPTAGVAYGEGTIFLLAVIFVVILFAVFCLMNTFYPVSRLKEIGVMKLQGYRPVDIWKQLNGRILIIPISFYMLTAVIQVVLIPNGGFGYLLKLSITQLVIFGVCLAFSLLMLVVIRKFSITSMLKNFFRFRFSLSFSYILKLLVFAGLVFTLPLMVNELERLSRDLTVRHIYESEQQYLTLSDFQYLEDEFQGLLNGDDSLGPKLTAFYQELEKTAGCQYIVTERLETEISPDAYTEKWSNISFNSNDNYNLMQANQNYLEMLGFDLPVNIKEAYSNDVLTFLVPNSLESEANQVEYLLRDYSRQFILADEDEEHTRLEDLPVRMIYYPDNDKKIFSQNIDMIDIENGFVQNPIILCLSDHFFSERTSLLQNSALYNPIRILNTEDNQNAIKAAIINNGLEQNEVQFGSVLSTGYARELEISQTSLVAWVGIILFTLLVSILASYYIVLIILTSRKKEILVSRILGYSIFDRYRNEVIYFSIIYGLGLVIAMIVSFQITTVGAYLFIVLIDSLIVYTMVKTREKRSLALMLKGEES